MNYYDPNGKKYTNNGSRIYDDKGYYIFMWRKNFSFSNMLVLFMKEIIIIGIFVIYFIKNQLS